MFNFAESVTKNLERIPYELQGDYRTWLIQQFKTNSVVDVYSFEQASWMLEMLKELNFDSPVEWYEMAEDCVWSRGTAVWSEVERQKGMDALTKAVKKHWYAGKRLSFVVLPEWMKTMEFLRPAASPEEVRAQLLRELGE